MKTAMRLLLVSTLGAAACDSGGPLSQGPGMEMPPPGSPPPPSTSPDPVIEARALFPRMLELHAGVIARTCSPNPGVCHHANNYPDLETPGNLLALVGAPCNLQMPDPKQGWDACERRGDKLFAAGVMTELAWLEKKSAGTWRIGLRAPAVASGRTPAQLYASDGSSEPMLSPPMDWDFGVNLVAGEREADLTQGVPDQYLTAFVDSVLATVQGGDPNQNGIYGADDPAAVPPGALIMPGSLAQSYLWGRITHTVPGSRMPLANQPLSDPEYIALACWIEGLAATDHPAALDAIDYDTCAFAQSPISYVLP